MQSGKNLNPNLRSNLLKGGLCGGPEWQEREAVSFAPRLQAAGYQVSDDKNGDGDQYVYDGDVGYQVTMIQGVFF